MKHSEKIKDPAVLERLKSIEFKHSIDLVSLSLDDIMFIESIFSSLQ